MKQSAPRHWYTSNVHERGRDKTRLLKHIIRWGNQPLMKANQADFIRILYIIIITDIIPLVFVWIKEKKNSWDYYRQGFSLHISENVKLILKNSGVQKYIRSNISKIAPHHRSTHTWMHLNKLGHRKVNFLHFNTEGGISYRVI